MLAISCPPSQPHFIVNFCPAITGAPAFSGLFFLPQIAHAFSLYAHLLQYFRPDSTFALHSLPVHVAEYAAYGFFAPAPSSFDFPMPFWPIVADDFVEV